jgi:hypothetical protein
MKVAVILSEAKDLHCRSGELMQTLRFTQNDRLFMVSGCLSADGHERLL